MEKIRTLIVDDEPIARRGIRQFLNHEEDFEVVGECTNGREALMAIEHTRPRLIFLDVQMPLLDGFGVARALPHDNLPEIVFVTAYDEHAISAFEVNAVDFLLKPVNQERFQKTLNRVREQINAARTNRIEEKLSALLRAVERQPNDADYPERIPIKENGRVLFLAADDIDWIVAQGNYAQIHSQGRDYLLRQTMNDLEQRLDPAKFIRLRRSTIVRIDRIKELQPLFNAEYAVILKDGTRLSSSRRYRKNLDALLKA